MEAGYRASSLEMFSLAPCPALVSSAVGRKSSQPFFGPRPGSTLEDALPV